MGAPIIAIFIIWSRGLDWRVILPVKSLPTKCALSTPRLTAIDSEHLFVNFRINAVFVKHMPLKVGKHYYFVFDYRLLRMGGYFVSSWFETLPPACLCVCVPEDNFRFDCVLQL